MTPTRVLFVCTGNSARSLMAEAVLRYQGGDAFEVHSAGTQPRGVNPLTLRVLAEAGIPADGLRSKDVEGYLHQPFDWAVTVCDRAREACPVFPGARRSLHWDLDDPAEAGGTDEERLIVFRAILGEITERVESFVTLVEAEAAASGGEPRPRR